MGLPYRTVVLYSLLAAALACLFFLKYTYTDAHAAPAPAPHVDQFQVQEIIQATTIYSTMPLNVTYWIHVQGQGQGHKPPYRLKGLVNKGMYDTFVRILESDRSKTVLLGPNVIGPVYYVADPHELSSFAGQYKQLYQSPPGYFVAFGLPEKLNPSSFGCSFDLSGKTVGYMCKTDLDFITAIINGHRIPEASVTLNYISIETTTGNSILQALQNVDVVISFIIPNNAFHLWLLQQRIVFMGFKKLDIHRINLFYPYTTMQDVNMKTTLLRSSDYDATTSTVTALIAIDEEDTSLPTMQLTVIEVVSATDALQSSSIGQPQSLLSEPYTSGVSPVTAVEEFITRLQLAPESLDPSYVCYGNVNISTKALCDSPYDEIGQPKHRTTTWDHPCTQDSDCPYFRANTNYENSFGGCGKQFPGVCELPIGIRRVSFRKYDDKDVFAPFCYGCDPYDTTCCSGQGDSPDYAFENDTDARQAAGLKTSIPMK